MNKYENEFNALYYYTLAHQSPSFIHQYVVDAQGAQTADKNTKPIRIVFSLVGLYLHLEKGYTGKEIQNFHKLMSQNKSNWPPIVLPEKRGEVCVSDVLATSPGSERDEMIRKWCTVVWDSFKKKNRTAIINLVNNYLVNY